MMASETPVGAPILPGSDEQPTPEPWRQAAATQPTPSAADSLAGLATELKSLIREDQLRRSKRPRNAF